MRNIFSRSQFKLITEDSTTVKTVANVSNEPLEITKAWKLSLIGALSAGVVAGLTKLYKMGRAKWAMNNLSSKLNKEYLKGLIFYADSVGLNLRNGTFGSGTTAAQIQDVGVQVASESGTTTSTMSASSGATGGVTDDEDINVILSKIKTIEELNASEQVSAIVSRWFQEKRLLGQNRSWIDTTVSKIVNPKEKDAKLKSYLNGTLLCNGKYNYKEQLDDFEHTDMLYKKIKAKENELKNQFSGSMDNLKKVVDEQGFNPNDKYSTGKMGEENFIDYQGFKEKFKPATADKVAVGDSFTYYDNKGERKNVTITDNQIGQNQVRVKLGEGGDVAINVDRLLPKDMPDFRTSDKSGVLDQLENTMADYGKNYDSLSDESKKELVDLYKRYAILSLTYKELVNSGKIKEKTTVSENLLLEKNLKLQNKGTGSIEGGDLVSKKPIPITDILTTKDQEKLKYKGVLSITVDDINFGKVSAAIDDTGKKEATKYVSKYNLEVIRLLADKYFGESEPGGKVPGFKKEWARRVNRINGYWEDIFDIPQINVLDEKQISTDPKAKDSVIKQKAKGDLPFDLSVISQKMNVKRIKMSELSGNQVILSFLYNSAKYILGGQGVAGVELAYQKLIRISKMLEVKREGDKEMISLSNQNSFYNSFRGPNSRVVFDNGVAVSGSYKIGTYCMFKQDESIPTDYNNPRKSHCFIINDIEYNEGGDKREICVYNKTDNKNYRLNDKFDYEFKTLKRTDFLFDIDLVGLDSIKSINDTNLSTALTTFDGPSKLDQPQADLIKKLSFK